jgi:hypothetical protein
MKLPARAFKDEPILVDRAAHYFGIAGRAFALRATIRADGTLTLTEDALIFSRGAEPDVEIPIAEIQRLGMGRWHEGTGTFVPVLKITYRGNLILGVQVARPERWIEAIEGLVRSHRLPALKGPDRAGFSPLRHSRIVIIGLLVLGLLFTALPAFFAWVQKSTLQEQGAEPPRDLPSAG